MPNVKILLIEDEPSICDNISFAAKKEGFAVYIANSGNGGLTLLPQHEFSLVILDVGLPDISGFEVCKEIRKKSNLPIIFLTGMKAIFCCSRICEMGDEVEITCLTNSDLSF